MGDDTERSCTCGTTRWTKPTTPEPILITTFDPAVAGGEAPETAVTTCHRYNGLPCFVVTDEP